MNLPTAEVLEGDDVGGWAFALFLRPHPGHLDSLCVPTLGNLPIKKKVPMPGGWPRGDGLCWN